MSCPHSTEGQKGMMVKTRIATYFPRLDVGAISDVAANAVSLAGVSLHHLKISYIGNEID